MATFPDSEAFIQAYREEIRGPIEEQRFTNGDGIFDYSLSLIESEGIEGPGLKALLDFLEKEFDSAPVLGEGSGMRTVIALHFISGIGDLDESLKEAYIEALPPGLKEKANAEERAKQLCLDLADADPWLAKYVDDQIEDDEQILPHVIVGDLPSKLLGRMERYGPDDHIITKVLDVLETSMKTDPEEPPIHGPINVIAISFIEHMPYRGEYGAKLAEMLPPAMWAELEEQDPEWAAEQRAKQ